MRTRVAYIHLLPLEYYPPAKNALLHFAKQPGWEVRAWSSRNGKGLEEWREGGVEVRRPGYAGWIVGAIGRMAGVAAWHLRVARELARWKPDVLLSVEPHSAFAVWLYLKIFRGKARLFIHHHEYYAPEDFEGPGMRLLKRFHSFERRDLYPRAEWVSQTNAERLRMLREWNPMIREEAAAVLPNHPPQAWVARRQRGKDKTENAEGKQDRLRLVYVGSASFRDTFIREAVEWVARFPEAVSLHVCGHNIHADVWDWLEGQAFPNVGLERVGVDYDALPDLLSGFDAGLVLYKGNTLNFVFNVPNKAIEYLVCGLEVWYPPEMEGMRLFHGGNPGRKLREIDFKDLPDRVPAPLPGDDREMEWTCERAMEPLLARIERARTIRLG